MQLLASLLFTGYLMVSACLWGGFMALCFFLPYRTHFAMARGWARWSLWMLDRLCGLNFRVEGRERIPAGNHIVMSSTPRPGRLSRCSSSFPRKYGC